MFLFPGPDEGSLRTTARAMWFHDAIIVSHHCRINLRQATHRWCAFKLGTQEPQHIMRSPAKDWASEALQKIGMFEISASRFMVVRLIINVGPFDGVVTRALLEMRRGRGPEV